MGCSETTSEGKVMGCSETTSERAKRWVVRSDGIVRGSVHRVARLCHKLVKRSVSTRDAELMSKQGSSFFTAILYPAYHHLYRNPNGCLLGVRAAKERCLSYRLALWANGTRGKRHLVAVLANISCQSVSLLL